jgi:sterol desaturase/sphingolipid hydroxylase (fatty acid hydroxylase superfamily)
VAQVVADRPTLRTPRPLAAVARGVYLPSVAVAGLTAWLVWRGASELAHYGVLGSSLSAALAELVGPIVLSFVFVVVICERLWPAERRPLLARGHVQDAAFFVLFAVGIVPLVTLLGVEFASLLAAHAPWLQLAFTRSWPRWLAVGLTLVAMDACNWLAHYADHRYRLLWRFHAVHHTQEELSVLTTFRTHPLVHTLSFLTATVPVVAIMPDHSLAPILVTVYLCLGALPHANVPWTFGSVGKLFCSPAYHRIHHAIDGPYDVNLGIVLTVWDVLARCAVFPVRGGPVGRTGLAGRPIAIEQVGSRYRPLRVLSAQLAEPFTPPMASSARTSR